MVGGMGNAEGDGGCGSKDPSIPVAGDTLGIDDTGNDGTVNT